MDDISSQRASSLKNISDDKKVTDKPMLAKSDTGVLKESSALEPAIKPKPNLEALLDRLRTAGKKRSKHVSLDEWFRLILEIDYFATVGLAASSDNTPTIGKLKEVPVNFPSANEYLEVFRPLVIEELKAQLRNEMFSSDDELSYGSMSVNVISVKSADQFHIVCLEASKIPCAPSPNDLIVLTTKPFQEHPHDVHAVGKVEGCNNRNRSSILTIKLYLPKTCSRLNQAKELLTRTKRWYIHRIISITSQLREFQALSSLQSIPIQAIILNPNNHTPNVLKSRTDLSSLSSPLRRILESSFNDCQLQAISSVTAPLNTGDDPNLFLIQGPPGTGKTRTIVGIVSALLSPVGSNDVTRRARNQLTDDASRATTSHRRRGRVLICAQSNAAVDEILNRISRDGLYGIDGLPYKPYIVRVGNSKTVKETSLPYFIDNLVDQHLQVKTTSDMQAGDCLFVEGNNVYEKRKQLRESILKEAEIVVTTLSGCGGELYRVCSESSLFDAVIVDEAAQALEPTTLIPLQLLKSKGSKSIMVGDPKQLPATVLSDVASKYLYQCSMFERLQKAGHPVTILTKQYRMHPEICRFPSLHFYDDSLVNGEGMSSKEKPFHKTKGLGPYSFFDIEDGQEAKDKSGSLYNEREADGAVKLVQFFKKSYPSASIGLKIGIITPYRAQISLLRKRFADAFESQTDEMELDTIDAFQGREVDILLLSTVRARAEEMNSRGIGFVADVRRMNVALTRAKHSLWILGNVRTLRTNKNWESLIKDANERHLVYSLDQIIHEKKTRGRSASQVDNQQHKRRKFEIQDENAKPEKPKKEKGNKKTGKKEIKWKKIITTALQSADGTLKISKLRRKVLKEVIESGSTIDHEQLVSIFNHKVNSSSKFTVKGKEVQLNRM